MPFRGKRSNRPRTNKTRKMRKSTKKPRVSTAVKQYVSKAIHSNAENKVYISYTSNQALNVLGVAASVYGNNAVYLLPQLSQGAGQGVKTGNEIKIRKAVVRGFVNLLPYNATSNPLSTPVHVKMWLVSFKTINSGLSTAINYANFFETGNLSASFQGNLLDMCFSQNKDLITVYKTKRFELGATYASTGGQVGTGGYFDNSRMSIPFYFDYSKHFRGTLKYNDTATNVPENRNCWLITQVVMADGSTSTLQPAEYHWNIRVEYEDM